MNRLAFVRNHVLYVTGGLLLLALGVIAGLDISGMVSADEGDDKSASGLSRLDDPQAAGIGFPLVFQPGGAPAWSLAFNVFSDGANVGIGTFNPGARLHVAEGGWILGSSSGLPGFGTSGWLTSPDGNLYEAGGGVWAHHFSAYGGGDIARFGTSGGPGQEPDTRVVISNDGNVGIGGPASDRQLDVQGRFRVDGRYPPAEISRNLAGDGGASATGLKLIRDSRADGAGTPTVNDGIAIDFHAFNDAGEDTPIAAISASITGITDGGEQGKLVFHTITDGTLWPIDPETGEFLPWDPKTAMALDSEGNVGIGTTDPRSPLHVQRDSGVDEGFHRLASISRTSGGPGNAGVAVSYFANGSEVDFTSLSFLGGDAAIRVRDPSLGQPIMPLYIRAEGGKVGIGTTDAQSALQVSGYTQLDLIAGSPPPEDCDEERERGRMKVDPDTDTLWVCMTSGWVAK